MRIKGGGSDKLRTFRSLMAPQKHNLHRDLTTKDSLLFIISGQSIQYKAILEERMDVDKKLLR